MERSVQHDLHLDWIPAPLGNDASGPIIKGRVKILEVLVCRMNLIFPATPREPNPKQLFMSLRASLKP